MRPLAPLAFALSLVAPLGSAATEREARALPFLSDDYAKALGEARARALPLFIEAWAPW
jgi:hypothetical protein